ncbi:family 10 glycosylhydrolase [Lusitaniella coriacea]|uniref:family 10 glycosylhydrolase n=1 Tax=Lusitaniella coriacea TaxID=1983105 RepID=UPI002D219556|nr:family 10 glycosylhydrolase [Lusitaniella coriacea]
MSSGFSPNEPSSKALNLDRIHHQHTPPFSLIWQRSRTLLSRLVRGSALTLICTLSPLAAVARDGRLAVVRSPENASQWAGITSRLQQAGVSYCTIELGDANPDAQLRSDIAVFFFPNIETMSGSQVILLQSWLSKGGGAIVSGPTGNLSQPEVRNQLRSLLGAYWGFPLTTPATLQPLRVKSQAWASQLGLSSTIKGGVMIPVGLDSQTAAVWQADGTPPAIVVTPQTTFLGWRWGVDRVSSSELDVAWLKAALSRYGNLSGGGSSAPSCLTSGGSTRELPTPPPAPPNITPQRPTPQSPPQSRNTPQRPISQNPPQPPVTLRPPNLNEQLIIEPEAEQPRSQPRGRRGTAISRAQTRQMQQELENLIGRLESALLLAAATEQENMSVSDAAERFQAADKATNPSPEPRATLVAREARTGLQTFLQLIDRGQYNQARQQWERVRDRVLASYPVDQPVNYPEIRAMWLDRGTIVRAKSEADLARIFDRLASAGINTIFFETVNASYSIYPSEIAPEQNPLVQGWDPLEAAVKLARDRGMELHAWVWIFAAANKRHNSVLGQPSNYPGPVLSRHPDWAMRDRAGNLFHPKTQKAFFDPANPEVQEYLLSLLEEIATRYDVDGIQLDYIRYPFGGTQVNHTYGYGTAARSQFRERTGVDPVSLTTNHPLWNQWAAFRIEQVDRFVAQASEQLRAEHPEIVLSAAVFPTPPTERLVSIQQGWETWIRNHQIDLLVPMTYALETEAFQDITAPLFTQRQRGSTLLLPGIRLLRLPPLIAVDQVQLLRDLPSGGYALFAFENLGLELQTILRRTQGKQPNPLPYRQPFQTANLRYQALQREWVFLLANQQLSIESDSLQEWGKQADGLATALQNVSDAPNPRNVRLAKSALFAFERQFGTWMSQHAQTQPYQVQAWENRLQSLERLLLYGERIRERS